MKHTANALRIVAALGVSLAAFAATVHLDVPFVPQPREGCGAAAISMVMRYWAAQDSRPPGEAADVARIQRELYSPKHGGIFASDMQKYFESHGYRVFAVAGAWTDLEQHVSRGRPVVLALGPASQRPLHYVVLTGVDSARGYVFINDPAQAAPRGKSLRVSRAAFEKQWQAAGNWMLLALPPS